MSVAFPTICPSWLPDPTGLAVRWITLRHAVNRRRRCPCWVCAGHGPGPRVPGTGSGRALTEQAAAQTPQDVAMLEARGMAAALHTQAHDQSHEQISEQVAGTAPRPEPGPPPRQWTPVPAG